VSEIPEGYHREWCVDKDWKVGGEGRRCRMKDCWNLAVAALKRTHRNAQGFRWWHYCESHLYGRKIEDGFVMVECLVENGREVSGAASGEPKQKEPQT
jgi:hypothetical protein